MLCAVVTPFGTPPVDAREVDDLAVLQRKVAVAEEAISSSMRRTLRDTLRVSNVESGYLARRGVLIFMDVSASWVSVKRRNSDLQISADLDSLADIPEMVQDIIEQLDITIAPYAPEELEALGELRNEQRELRDQRRDIYADLRHDRRAMVRAREEEPCENEEQVSTGSTACSRR